MQTCESTTHYMCEERLEAGQEYGCCCVGHLCKDRFEMPTCPKKPIKIDWAKLRETARRINAIAGSWQVKVEAIMNEQATDERYQLAAIIDVCESALVELSARDG